MNQDVLKSKEAVVNEIANLVKDNGAMVICEYRGLTVAKISKLRNDLREKGASMCVYKNSLVTRALKDTHEGIEEYLAGPNVYVFAKDATDGSLKVLTKFAKKNEELVLKGGIIDGKVSDKDYVMTIASLPSKEGLVSMLLSVLQAPMRNLAYSLGQVAEHK
ncbi:MAG: 50S ribosomal protein L10 [Candidatus Onthovivens sp.]|nr:50S ribosomal protein L10 [Mollicutes bacterium]MDY4857583.1 50S ribosomal protein L10 [Candidatus Onthovivens sp.]MDY4936752.1 50S ribosomal protein L10 [Candidatus Onthovivens sp.]